MSKAALSVVRRKDKQKNKQETAGGDIVNNLPDCYRCGSSPCTCRDGCTLLDAAVRTY